MSMCTHSPGCAEWRCLKLPLLQKWVPVIVFSWFVLAKSCTCVLAVVLGVFRHISHQFSFQRRWNLSLPTSARLVLYCLALWISRCYFSLQFLTLRNAVITLNIHFLLCEHRQFFFSTLNWCLLHLSWCFLKWSSNPHQRFYTVCKLEDKPQFEIDFASITKQKHSGGSWYGSIKWMVFQGANNTDPGHFEILKIPSFVKKL